MRKPWVSGRREAWLRRLRQFFGWGNEAAPLGRRIFSDFSGNFRQGFSGSASGGVLSRSQRLVQPAPLGSRRLMSVKTVASRRARRLRLSSSATSPQSGSINPESGFGWQGKSLRLSQASGRVAPARRLMAAPRPYPRASLNLNDPALFHEPRPMPDREPPDQGRKPFSLNTSPLPAWDALLADYADYAWTRRLI